MQWIKATSANTGRVYHINMTRADAVVWDTERNVTVISFGSIDYAVKEKPETLLRISNRD